MIDRDVTAQVAARVLRALAVVEGVGPPGSLRLVVSNGLAFDDLHESGGAPDREWTAAVVEWLVSESEGVIVTETQNGIRYRLHPDLIATVKPRSEAEAS